jgi:hypothetical protein
VIATDSVLSFPFENNCLEANMRLNSLVLFLVFIIVPVWFSVAQVPQPPGNAPTRPTEAPATVDPTDPLFQEFVRQVEKSGPILQDPGAPPKQPDPYRPQWSGPVGSPPHALHGPLSPDQREEMRWQAVEQLLRNAREIRSQADFFRSIGQAAQADRLSQLANDLRKAAIESAPSP